MVGRVLRRAGAGDDDVAGESTAENVAESDDSVAASDRCLRTDGGVEPAHGAGTPETSLIDRLRRSEFVESLPFWGPPGLLVLIFVYGAVAWNFVISLTGWEGLRQPTYDEFTLEMYRTLLTDASFIAAFRNTLVLLVVFTVLSLALGLVLAILVDRDIRFENTFRTIYLLPMSLSFVVTAIFWSWLYNPRIGLINEALRAVHLDFLAQAWLADPRFKLAAIIFALMWQFSGYCMVVYLAGLRAIPTDQYEAARIDGASTIRLYWRVIVPQLRASTMSAAVVLMVFALKAFDFLFVLFGVNPGRSADILAVMMYRVAFDRLQWAYGAAVAMVLFVMALGVIGPYLYLQYRRGEL
ncbi:ABC-type sugar transport system, permease component [Halalkaliarchaeum sp. AArc-CO]|uniref:carbohydrate ABC transporter permease n=1 Tax=unclassified Halalkaliarchaeum TaxID=2678344 RepID=UPI00217DE0C7|nr:MULTISPECIES: sugar ABC transporter permease [unclassified Halalkaliarchaeum]MDR5673325.1 sugar ABC transporter permease [Halalkaliarchaeum sp. AArc-GB]UWG49666.1 ABC-type sugar transport system, permease component [Halalkaliarchaeum sp. AArc-CO]